MSFAAQQQMPPTTGRVSLARTIFSYISFDAFSKFRPKRRDTSEGIIAPRSPLPPAHPSSPITSYPTSPLPAGYRSSMLGERSSSPAPRPRTPVAPPPRSPLPRTQELQNDEIPNGNFRLKTPPGGRPMMRRAATGDASNLGVRASSATREGSGLGVSGAGLGLRKTSSSQRLDE